MKKLAIVYGTRPEFLKLQVLMDELRAKTPKNFDQVVFVKINQHADLVVDQKYSDRVIDISDVSFCDDQNKEIEKEEEKKDRISLVGSNILLSFSALIKKEKITHVLAQGDTASVFYTLLCAFQMGLYCIHLEAGMRTYDLKNPFPEEGYRQMISRIADLHLCPSASEQNNLIKEGIPKSKTRVVGNTILDLVRLYNVPVTLQKRVLITIHRRENWPKYLEIVQNVAQLALTFPSFAFVFVMHYNRDLQTIAQSFFGEKKTKNLELVKPMDHRETIKILSECSCVITDSGGIQEEANFLGKKCWLVRKTTERLVSFFNLTILADPQDISKIDLEQPTFARPGLDYGDGHSVEQVLNVFDQVFI